MRSISEQEGGRGAFALKLSMSYPLVSNYIGKNPSKQIGSKLARKIENVYNLPHGWMDKEHSAAHQKTIPLIDNATLEPMQPKIPLISTVAAGNWGQLLDLHAVGDAIEWVSTSKPPRRNTFALRVQGDSMMPRFEHGAIITVEPDEVVQHGRYVVAKRKQDSEATFKQYVLDAGRAYLKPLNPQYPTLEVDDDCRIVGVVVDVTMRLI